MEDISCPSKVDRFIYTRILHNLYVYNAARQDETVSLCSEGRLVTEFNL